MSKQREALKLALQALEEISAANPDDWEFDICADAKKLLREALAEPARKPLTDEQIDKIIASNVTITDRNLYGAVYMAIREVEAAHGIGGEE